ncbi:MAG: TonB-dependent receptor, partial [Saprospiraceae bacterium]|nr:TonB-dependent receptor [Saprospiraceae bacterium]
MFAQQMQIEGIISDDEGVPLIGVNILRVGTAAGTTTNFDGQFSLEAQLGDSLSFRYLGYTAQGIRIKEPVEAPLQIVMTPTSELIECFIEVRVVRLPVNVKHPAPVMTLHEEDLQRDDRTSIRPALNRVPGVLMHSGALNTNRITIRGIGNRSPFTTAKIRAYFNDIPITNGVGETTLEDIDLSLIDQVDIWKGPTGSTYGAGLGGMIHLKSDPALYQTGTRAQLEGSYGAYGTRRLAAGLQFGPQKIEVDQASWNLKMHYHNMHSDGYRANNQYDRQGLALIGSHQDAKANITTLLANFVDLKAFIPSSLNREDYVNEPQKAAFTWGRVMGFEDSKKLLLGLSHEHHLAQNSSGNNVLDNVSSFFGTWYENYESRPFNILTEDNQALGGRTRFILHPGGDPAVSIQAGAELFVENYDWQTYRTDNGRQDTLRSNNTEVRSYYNLFVEAAINLGERFRIEAGLNSNQTKYELTDRFLIDNQDLSGEYRFENILSPRLGLLYRLPNDLRFFGSISHGFASPTLEETLTPDGNINPDLQPEKGWNFEVGIRKNRPGSRLNYELTAYSMPIKDLLVARRTALDQYVGINAGKTLHQGIEAYGQYTILGQYAPQKQLSVFANYTYSNYRFDIFIDDENDYSGNDLTGTPPHVINWGLDYNPQGEGL